MRHIIFEQNTNYQTALLIKASSFNKQQLIKNYVSLMDPKTVIGFTLKYDDKGKVSSTFMKEYLKTLMPALNSLSVKYLYVADSNYFKVLAGVTKAELHTGYAMPCKIKGYEHMTVVLGVNYQALIFNPEIKSKLDRTMEALISSIDGTYSPPGNGIIASAYYPSNLESIATALDNLHQYPSLTCDIETFSLRLNEAGIGTIAFAWDQHNGISFAVDYSMHGEKDSAHFGINIKNEPIRKLIKKFLSTYKGELTFHNATFDVRILIYNLWMKDGLDTKGLLTGLEIMCRNMHDTKIISYLATNTTAGNVLSLKHLAHEFAGNWAVEEIKDITRIPLVDLLQYNLVDALSTHYVRNKYEPVMIHDKQEELYKTLMLDSVKLIIQIELTGMPMSRKRIQEVKAELLAIKDAHLKILVNNPIIDQLNNVIQTDAMIAANAKLKVKQHPLSKFSSITFNPDSPLQLQKLLYQLMGLPVIDLTETKQPATGGKTIEKLLNHATDTEHIKILQALIGYGSVITILTNFIPAFEKAISKDDSDIVWLHGSFNIGGTVSGRMSSSSPNLQQIPSNSIYGELIKSCFVNPENQIMCGADFNSLEDMISALTTKDPNKLKVYIDGYCGHSLRASYYFPQKMPDITEQLSLLPSDTTYEITNDDGSLFYAKGSDILGHSGKTIEELYNERNT